MEGRTLHNATRAARQPRSHSTRPGEAGGPKPLFRGIAITATLWGVDTDPWNNDYEDDKEGENRDDKSETLQTQLRRRQRPQSDEDDDK